MILDIRDPNPDNKLRCSKAVIRLNGVPQTRCVRVDDQKGIAVLHFNDITGNTARDRRGRALTKTVRGKVEITLPAPVPLQASRTGRNQHQSASVTSTPPAKSRRFTAGWTCRRSSTASTTSPFTGNRRLSARGRN